GGVDLEPGDFGARLDHFLERLLFEGGVALDHIDEVGHEVAAPLVLVLNFGPSPLHVFVALDDVVVTAAGERRNERQAGHHVDDGQAASKPAPIDSRRTFSHDWYLP